MSASETMATDETAGRRVTVRVSDEIYAKLVLAKLLTRKSFNALVEEGIVHVEARYRRAAQSAGGEED